MTNDLHYTNILDLAKAYRAKTLSPVEVTRHMLARIDQLDQGLHSYFTVTADIALEQAKQAEQEMQQGIFRSLLHGVPIGIKDLCETRNVVTSWGSPLFVDNKPKQDATVVKKLNQSGSIMLGKLHMTEGAYTLHHPKFPTPVNPWNAEHWSGASSSGSGVATAAGLCFGAVASDTGGSIRLPSSANGVTGLKPTWGRVSRAGVLALADSLDHIGPMARSAADAGIMLGAMAGVDPRDPTSLPDDVPDYLANLNKGVRGLRIGFDPRYIYESVQQDTAEVINHVRQVLTDLGAELVEVEMPANSSELYPLWANFCSAETAIAHEATYPSRANEYGKGLADLIEMGREQSAIDLMRVYHARLAFNADLNKLFKTIDLLLMPVHAFGNPSAQELETIFSTPEGIDGVVKFTGLFNFSGSPTLTMPGGFTERGVPIGFQLVGRHLDESLLVQAGHAYQQATRWHDRHPSI